jgi:primosomal protein N' (replication factor Y)
MDDPAPHTPPPFAQGAAVSVLSPDMPARALDYRAPEGGCAAGDVVLVPLGARRRVVGVVWGAGSGEVAPERLRDIDRVLDVVPLAPELRGFLDRAAAYTLSPPGAMLRLATRVPGLGEPPPDRRILRAAAIMPPAGTTAARARVLGALARFGGAGLGPAELAREAGTGTGTLAAMVKAGLLIEGRAPRDAPLPRLDPDRPAAVPSEAQGGAIAALRAAVAAGGYGTTLLQGVTGSGKTEVYLEAVAEALRQGRQALVLLPEIALTADFIARVAARFGAAPAEWHSGVAAAQRRQVWHAAARGEAGLIVGARSALFLPFLDLALIVVDEEHDPSYKQEDGVTYHARDMAVLRASGAGAQVVLASATPSLESWANAEAGRYRRLTLPARYGAARLPELALIDLRVHAPPAGRWISPPLEAALTARLRAGEQSLLFLNRRGYAPVTVCRACGQQIGCHDCDARMVEHRFARRLVCHQCGASRPIPTACPACGVEGRLAALGPGVERLAEEVAAVFPDARVKVLASDLFASARALKAEVSEIAAGGADIVIGTQIVAKGHDFPLLTLVGVIDADLGLQGSDLRAAERSFQLIRQVSGRAGRREVPGQALIQTLQPDHPVMRAIAGSDDEAFRRAEAAARAAAGMPPYGRLAAIILSGPDAEALHAHAEALARAAPTVEAVGAEVWGPAPAPVARIRGRHRLRFLIRAAKGVALQGALARWVASVPERGAIRAQIDIDPQSFL